MYTFDEGAGTSVLDVSGVGSALDLNIPDLGAVTWGAGTLTLDQSTTPSSLGAASKISDGVKASGEITVEAWIAPANTTQTGPSRIVSVSSSPTTRNFTLGQGDSGVVASDRYSMRLRTTTTGNNGNQPTATTAGGSLTTALTHVVYTRDAAGFATFYLDGILVANTTISGSVSNWDSSYNLLLGNEASGDRPWLGTFSLVAIYDRALNAPEVDQNFQAGP